MLSSHTHPSQELSRHATYRRLSGWGLLEAADLSGEGGEAMTTTMIREEMTTSTTSRLCPPRPHNNKPFGQGEGGPFGRGEGGGAATVDAILQGRVGDATKEEKIRTTATEKEKEWVRARATRRTAVAGGGAGAKTTTTEAAVARSRLTWKGLTSK